MSGVFKKIKKQNRTITPFQVYKSWLYTSETELESDDFGLLVGRKPNNSIYPGNVETFGTEYSTFNTYNDIRTSAIWYHLNHLYYNKSDNPFQTFLQSSGKIYTTNLYDVVSVISIPKIKYGECIKPNSVDLYTKIKGPDTSPKYWTASFQDDGSGNLIDLELSSSISNEVLYFDWNAMKYEKTNISGSFYKDWKYRTIIPQLNVKSKNVDLADGFITFETGFNDATYGTAAKFDDIQKSYIRISNCDELNFHRTNDYAISFWFKPEDFDIPTQYILSKRTTGNGQYLSESLVYTGEINFNEIRYPYEISLSNYTMSFSISNGPTKNSLYAINDGSTYNHFIMQKSGSIFELYVDGVKYDSCSLDEAGDYTNNADIFLGCLGLDSDKNAYQSMAGQLQEFMIFDKALSQNEVTQLSEKNFYSYMGTNTNIVGQVFYTHGLIAINDPRPKYYINGNRSGGSVGYRTCLGIFSGNVYNDDPLHGAAPYYRSCLNEISLSFNSTLTKYEHEYVCVSRGDEFNFTMNPTIRENNDPRSEKPKGFVSSSYFSPYITTIGLYDDYGRLLAVGKLGTPIHKRDDVDLNLIVRFDI